jgi:hypothetical protein
MNCGEQGCTHVHVTQAHDLAETFRLSCASLMREAHRSLRAGDTHRARVYGWVLSKRLQEAGG